MADAADSKSIRATHLSHVGNPQRRAAIGKTARSLYFVGVPKVYEARSPSNVAH